MVNASMETMPIWAVPNTPPPPVDPVVPPPPADGDCMKLTEKEKALIEFLRSQETKFGEKAFDWAQIIRLVLELIQLIQAGRS
jgi:hypothetical protein